MKTKSFLLILILLPSVSINGQNLKSDQNTFTRQDTLRGSITAERDWWDLNYYRLDIVVNPKAKSIKGKNTIRYTILKANQTLQML